MKKKLIVFLGGLIGLLPLKVFGQTLRGHLTGQVAMPVTGVPIAFTAATAISTHLQNKAVLIRKKSVRPLVASRQSKTINKDRHHKMTQMVIQADKMILSSRIDSIDLRSFAPSVADQQYPVCYAYASVYAARTLLYNKAHQITWQPDTTVFSTAFLQKMMCVNAAICQTKGFDTYKACQMLRDSGSVFQRDFGTEDCSSDTITSTLRKKARHYRVNANMVFTPCDSDTKKRDSIRVSLARGLPVIVTWISTDSFNVMGNGVPLWQPDSTDYVLNVCHDTTNHAFCIVGFNNIKYDGAFLVMNSWGTDWGIDGFMWIKYSDMAHFAAFGIVLSDLRN
ncbi:C1 family peptidase [Mucilaginibacter sp. HC2]|uniref:C1 family peptidase n=1 Tax=Mucilaginibacter inviolabilis TaxID=2714892 RepID=UPI00140BB85E|nr:C1 family peptidase [Mucilaginibacter inviolabilis]NHA03493.1 C1 family peptidase [Mucilaginibacter inviolabilis]